MQYGDPIILSSLNNASYLDWGTLGRCCLFNYCCVIDNEKRD